MTLTEKAMKYAQGHLQAVRIVWVDRPPDTVSAVDAVALCADRGTSGRIVAAVAQEKRFEDMLNKLIDAE